MDALIKDVCVCFILILNTHTKQSLDCEHINALSMAYVLAGYHWDTSDWVPMSEDGDIRDRNVDRHGYPAAARLLVRNR